MQNSLIMGEFNSEKYWRSESLAKLPEFPDISSADIILSMDELLFPFCEDNDVLVTRYPFDSTLKHYLNTLGFKFSVNPEGVQNNKEEGSKNIFQLVCENTGRISGIRSQLSRDTELTPYSILPYTHEMTDSLNLFFSGPGPDVVKEVNSKIYSLKLSRSLDLKYCGDIIGSSRELSDKGKILLERGPFLIKDPFGVSGKGNMLVNSEGLLKRIVKHLESQEQKGLESIFAVEPYLDRDIDFSCGFNIDQDGNMKIISVQKMINNKFAYLGSSTAGGDFIERLDKDKYFNVIDSIAKALYKDGYYGDVCVDSMLLTSGDIVPIVEINARKSMGFINYSIDRYLSRFNQKGNLMFLNLGYKNSLTFEDLLKRIDEEGLLYYTGKTNSIMPLSANTLFMNREKNYIDDKNAVYKGRFYFSVIAEDDENRVLVLNNIRNLFKSISCNIYN